MAELVSDSHNHVDDEHKDTVKTVEDYRAYVREQLEETYNDNVRKNQYLYTWTAIVNGCEIKKYPESAVKKLGKDLYNYNYTWFVASGYGNYGLTPANLGITKENCNKQARETTPYTAETYLKTTSRQSIETKVLYDKIVGEAIASATFTEAK